MPTRPALPRGFAFAPPASSRCWAVVFVTLPMILALAIQAVAEPPIVETRDLIIVAGQSNAVGFDAPPRDLTKDAIDTDILFWWRCGDPPPDDHDSVSERWQTLGPQPLGTPAQKESQPRQYGNFSHPEGGFGPEIGIARRLAQTASTSQANPIAVLKVAFSGTSLIRDWDSQSKDSSGACYRALIAEFQTASAAARAKGIALRPRALAWIQGESDANAELADQYADAMQRMLADLRRDLGSPTLNVALTVNAKFGGENNKFMPAIVSQQRLAAARDPHCRFVDTSSATIANRAHFDGPGTLTVGHLMADAIQRLEVERRRTNEKPGWKIVTLGDSITKGVRSGVAAEQTFAGSIANELPNAIADVVNVGIGGERTDQALRRLDGVLLHNPDVVTVMYGTNDSYVDQGKTASRLTVDAYRKNLNQIVARILVEGAAPVLMTPPRWSARSGHNGLGENPNIKLEPYVAACRDVAATWSLPLVDHFAAWTAAEAKGQDLHAWTTDGCHPNSEGHAQMAKLIATVLRTRLPRHCEAASQKLLTGKSLRVVCFGDSVTGVYYHTGSRRAYTALLGDALRRVSPEQVEMINAGLSGHTTVNALSRIENDVLKHKPDVVTVMFGLNDMTRVSLDDYRDNLTEIVQRCRGVGAEVVLATPNNVTDTPPRPTPKLSKYCDIVREVAQKLSVPLCDCYQRFEAERVVDASRWSALMSDTIHPNLAGHALIAQQLAFSISGQRLRLDNWRPQLPLDHLRTKVERARQADQAGGMKLRVIAMDGATAWAADAVRSAVATIAGPNQPAAVKSPEIEVSPWNTSGKSLQTLEQDAKQRIRSERPDLVIIAVPHDAHQGSPAEQQRAYEWIINYSLNFGPPTWDVWVVHPKLLDQAAPASAGQLATLTARNHDLPIIGPGDVPTKPLQAVQQWLATPRQ